MIAVVQAKREARAPASGRNTIWLKWVVPPVLMPHVWFCLLVAGLFAAWTCTRVLWVGMETQVFLPRSPERPAFPVAKAQPMTSNEMWVCPPPLYKKHPCVVTGGGGGGHHFHFPRFTQKFGIELLPHVCWLDKVVAFVHCRVHFSCIQGTSVDSGLPSNVEGASASGTEIVWAKSARGVWGLPNVSANRKLYFTRDIPEPENLP